MCDARLVYMFLARRGVAEQCSVTQLSLWMIIVATAQSLCAMIIVVTMQYQSHMRMHDKREHRQCERLVVYESCDMRTIKRR